MKLLWTNPNPKSTFSGQTINLDLGKYNYVEIVSGFNRKKDVYYEMVNKFEVGHRGSIMIIDDSCNFIGMRNAIINEDSVTFGVGYYACFNNDNNRHLDNDYAVPLKIYGIR